LYNSSESRDFSLHCFLHRTTHNKYGLMRKKNILP
jgi:hypothetical protein